MRRKLENLKLRFTSRILRKPTAPTSNSSQALYPSHTTFRLQGIPALLSGHFVSKHDVLGLVQKAWNIDKSASITIHSLATDPSDDTKKISTLSFKAPPQFLSRPALKWTTTLQDESESSIDLALDVEFFGLTPFHCEPDADCTYDIVALSGLNGHAFGSFKQRGESSFMWLRDALPQHLTQAGVHARVYIYGYDARLIKSDSFQEISDLGLELKNKIVQLTQSSSPSGMRRLILIGHSLGGILIKQAIVSLDKNAVLVEETRALTQLLGSIFFGTPSQGMDIETILPMVDGQPNELFIRTLGSSTGTLRNQMDDFRRSFERLSFSAIWYYETNESPTARQCESGAWKMDGPKRRLVDISSATNGMPHDYGRHTVRPVNRSHSDMVKFQGATDEVYRQVLADLKNMILSPKSGMVYKLTEDQEDFLKSLDFARQDSRRNTIAKATENTCAWFFNSLEFRTWINSQNAAVGKGLLWVKGNPGVGKSTLMREALRRTQDYVSQDLTSILSFFFNARGEELEKTTLGLYRSLLHQVLRRDLKALHCLWPVYVEKLEGRGSCRVEWEEEELKDCLLKVFQCGISRPVIVFIDALDECTDPEISQMVEIFEGLVNQLRSTNTGLRVCISSRHCPRPRTFGYPELVVERHNENDIYTYITAELKNYETLLRLRYQILDRSSGVFLWVRLVIRELRKEVDMHPGRPFATLEKKLMDIPSELGTLFNDVLERIDPVDRPRSTFLFQLVLFATVRLSANEVAAAISFHPGNRFYTMKQWAESGEHISGVENRKTMIVNLSGGLLEFDNGDGWRCQFIHESARDYILKSEGCKSISVAPKHVSTAGWCHSEIATACVNYLRAVTYETAFDELLEVRKTNLRWDREHVELGDAKHVLSERGSFLSYTLKHVYDHIERAEEGWISQEMSLRRLGQMDEETNHVFHMVSSGSASDFDPRYTQISRCCKGGMRRFRTIWRLIKMAKDPCAMINKRDKEKGSYPLITACTVPDSERLVELLLRNGAYIWARNKRGRDALLSAAKHSNLGAVRSVLSYGADIESRDIKNYTVLHHSIRSGVVMKLLLEKGARHDVQSNSGWTPLVESGFHLRYTTFELLVDAGANVNYKTPHGGETALHIAIRRLTKSVSMWLPMMLYRIVERQIVKGFDLKAVDDEGNTCWNCWMKFKDKLSSTEEYEEWEKMEQLLRICEEGQS